MRIPVAKAVQIDGRHRSGVTSISRRASSLGENLIGINLPDARLPLRDAKAPGA
jgi:hypothetical protein